VKIPVASSRSTLVDSVAVTDRVWASEAAASAARSERRKELSLS
jgi:hypothetical protein